MSFWDFPVLNLRDLLGVISDIVGIVGIVVGGNYVYKKFTSISNSFTSISTIYNLFGNSIADYSNNKKQSFIGKISIKILISILEICQWDNMDSHLL